MAEPPKPKPKSKINPKVTQRQVSDTARLSHKIPDAVKVSMAGAIMRFRKWT